MEITYKERQSISVTDEECKGINLDTFKTISDMIPLISQKDDTKKNLPTFHLLLTKKFVNQSLEEV